MEQKKRWADFTSGQKKAIVVGGAVELVLTTVALTDLAKRPKANVRGPRVLWALGCFVQPLGPITYLLVGRRRR